MFYVVTIVYALALLYIFLFSLSQLQLTFIYLRQKRKSTPAPTANKFRGRVTIQLPIYNERYVVERLLANVVNLDYPSDQMEIQIIDDSTDDTRALIDAAVEKYPAYHITVVRRANRKGFKAGALDYALGLATGDYIAIFDADFIPDSDFLKKTLPYFADTSVGAVQTRWGHLNKNYSWLTRLQAFGLDAHFSIEQSARNAAGSFINFNGTCGVWRKSCIVDAGGWSDDTLTEDLDLSYRAQLRGWKFQYLEEVVTPGELPVVMQAVKTQQYRWNKGGAETARKIFGRVLRAKMPLQHKVHAFFHLFNSSVFMALLLAALTSIPMLLIKAEHPEIDWLFKLGLWFLIGFLSISFFYWTSTKRFYTHAGRTFLLLFPRFLIVSMGLSLHNGIAVIEGLLGIKTPFIRTPKFNVFDGDVKWQKNSYVKRHISLLTILEGLLAVYFAYGIVLGLQLHDRTLLIFHAMLTVGFLAVFYFSVRPLKHA